MELIFVLADNWIVLGKFYIQFLSQTCHIIDRLHLASQNTNMHLENSLMIATFGTRINKI